MAYVKIALLIRSKSTCCFLHRCNDVHFDQYSSNTCHMFPFHRSHEPRAHMLSPHKLVERLLLRGCHKVERWRHGVVQTTRYGSSRHQEAEIRHCQTSNPGCFRWAHPQSAFVAAPAPNRSAPAPSPALRTPSMSP